MMNGLFMRILRSFKSHPWRSLLVTSACVGLFIAVIRLYKSSGMGTDPESTKPRIVLYNWSNYMDPDVLLDFQKETGIEVIEEIFDSNESLRAKMLAGADGYDVIVPSGYMVDVLVRESMLAPLDMTLIPNQKNIGAFFRNLYFDPHEKYSIPYLYMSTGIGYRSDVMKEPPTSWAYLFDEKHTNTHLGKISMLDDAREVIGAALQYLGFSINSTEPNEINAAVALLQKQKPWLARYDSEVYGDLLVAGDLDLALGWGGTIAKSNRSDARVRYVVPKEGGIIGVDCLVIPKNSQHIKEAHQLINFILRPDISARIVNKTKYPSVNSASHDQIDPKILKDESIYHPSEVLSRMEWIKDVGAQNELYEKAWETVRLSQ